MVEILVPRLRQELVERLRQERDRLCGSVRVLTAAERILGESQGMESDAGGDAGDVASDLAEQEVDLVLKESERERLAEVDAALRRVAQGTYGTCETCGGPIAVERLYAILWARRCIGCAQRTVEAERIARGWLKS
jgi:DnaK suppressor protein